MENASKALLIAAGTLMGIMIISIIVVFSNVFGGFAKEYTENMQTSKVQAFNAQFSKYENIDLKAQDVLTIINLAQEWEKVSEEVIEIKNISANEFTSYEQLKEDINKITSSNSYVLYSMKITEYNSEGRVSKITINKQ